MSSAPRPIIYSGILKSSSISWNVDKLYMNSPGGARLTETRLSLLATTKSIVAREEGEKEKRGRMV